MAARAVLYAAVVAAVLGPAAGQVQCKDENGNAVDWWAMFKLPNGYKAAFWTSAEANNGLNVNADLSSAGNPLQECVAAAAWRRPRAAFRDFSSRAPCAHPRTLSGVWDNQGHVLYNDENPESGLAAKAASNASSLRSADWVKYGHTKGVLAFDGSTGFWLVHSVPRFPQANDWSYPEDETIYGQSFLCVSLDAGGIEDVGGLLVLNKPSVYASNLPSSYADQVRRCGRRQRGGVRRHIHRPCLPPLSRSSPPCSACWPSSGTRRRSRTTRSSSPPAASPSSRSPRTGNGTRWARAAAAPTTRGGC